MAAILRAGLLQVPLSQHLRAAGSAYATSTASRWAQGKLEDADARPVAPPRRAAAGSAATAGAGGTGSRAWQRPPRRPAGGAADTQLATQAQHSSLLQRTVEAAAEAVHKLVVLVSSLRRMGANEAYVASYLQRTAGFDSFTLEYLHVARPGLFRLSVARDIDPVICWLKSIGMTGEQLVELVRHTPAVLSLSVDEQLEPLAAFISSLGGSPAEVLLAYPALMAAPVPATKGTRHVLRQLGVADSDIALLLTSFPDLYEQLALTLQQLFTDFAKAGWKLAARQRRQLSGMVHHHMRFWNRGARQQGLGGGHGEEAEAEGGMGQGEVAQQPHQQQPRTANPHTHPPAHMHRHHAPEPPPKHQQPRRGPFLRATFLVEREVFQGLQCVVAALETLAGQPEGEEREAAVEYLAHTIAMLGHLPSARSRGMGDRQQPESLAA